MRKALCSHRPSRSAYAASALLISPAAASPSGTRPGRSRWFSTAKSTISAIFARNSRPAAIASALAPTPKSSSMPTKPGARLAPNVSTACSLLPLPRCLKGRPGPPLAFSSPETASASSRSITRSPTGALLFASEARALLASGCVPARLSAAALPSYLLFGSVGEPSTLVEGVSSLRPGYCMTVPIGGSLALIRTAPLLEFRAPRLSGRERRAPAQESAASPARQVRSLLESAVASHLIADVPLGVFLSSGLDSTAIAALASRAQAGVHTFTVAFPDVEFSEAEEARRTARASRHRALRADPLRSRNAHSSRRGHFRIRSAQHGRHQHLLCLLGRAPGGPESCALRPRQRRAFRRLSLLSHHLPSRARFPPWPVFCLGPSVLCLRRHSKNSRSSKSSAPARRLLKKSWRHGSIQRRSRILIFSRARSSRRKQSLPTCARVPRGGLRCLGGDGFRTPRAKRDRRIALPQFPGWNCAPTVNTLLRDTDAMSMRQSLEVRVPFLDSPLVEYVLSLPENAKRGPAGPKSLLIEALGDLLPPETLPSRSARSRFRGTNGSAERSACASRRAWRIGRPRLRRISREPLRSLYGRIFSMGAPHGRVPGVSTS